MDGKLRAVISCVLVAAAVEGGRNALFPQPSNTNSLSLFDYSFSPSSSFNSSHSFSIHSLVAP